MTKSQKTGESQQSDDLSAPSDAPRGEQSEAPDGEQIRISPLLVVLGCLAVGVGLLAGLMMSSVALR